MSGYTDQVVLECSRTSSAEGRTNNNKNPAEFTNDLGDGVVLEIGDEIELHSAYVSELGAQAGSIEIKDRVTGDIVPVYHTAYEKAVPDINIPTGFEWEIGFLNRSEIRINDKETFMVVSPYKTTNGEFTMALPRRYCFENHNDNRNWNYFATTETPFTNNLGNVKNTLDVQTLTGIDQHPSQFCPDDYEIVYRTGFLPPAPLIKKGQIKNNNQRFTIFRATNIYFNASAATAFGTNGSMSGLSALSTFPDVGSQQNATARRDPATLLSWNQVKDLIKLEAKEGFNTPEDVAFDLTQQLNERTNFEKKEFMLGTAGAGTLQKVCYTSKTETPCYKTYNCGTPDKMNLTMWNDFRNASSGVTAQQVDNAYNYLSSYQHIGVKRPDLFTEGRFVNTSGGYIIPAGYDIFQNSQVMPLGITWSDRNITSFDKYFAIQAKYTELFDGQIVNGQNCSATTNRFLHFNTLDDFYHRPMNSLGYDLYDNGVWAGGLVNASQATFPCYFDFNPATVNYTAGDVEHTTKSGPSDYQNLAHGWARKVEDPLNPGQYVIGIQFSLLGNIVPNYLFSIGGGHTHIAAPARGGRRFGHDYHFSAYGNPCIGLWNGFSNQVGTSNGSDQEATYHHNSASTGQIENLPKWLSEIYLGADQPLISYDEEGNRFNISQLHVSEVEGNTGEAGRLGGGASIAEEVNAQSNASCYKINKKLLKNNWSPDVSPYTLTLPAGGSVPLMEQFSTCLTPWTPYDMMGGLFIEEFVVPQYQWNTNLMGVMGYRYEQFNHSPYNASNRQTRIIDNQQVSKAEFPTTNAKINEGDLRSFNMNLWNNPQYNINLPTSHTVVGGVGGRYNRLAAVDVVGISSTMITAQELPTKSIRPYYTIRSDIIGKNNFIGESAGLPAQNQTISSKPIVGLVDKVNGYGDYYTEQTGQLSFTNTEKRVITSIKTSIHDPDGTYADCGLTSSVIYKITRNRPVDLTPLNTLLESKKKKDKETALKAEGYIPPQKYSFK